MSPEHRELAHRLGYAGLAPFVLGCLLIWLIGDRNLDQHTFVSMALSGWAGLVIAFLGGIHWGLSFVRNLPGRLWGYPAGFFGLTLALSAHLWRSARRAREIETKVAERTVELTREIAARRQVELRLRGAEAWLEEQVRERTRELSHANERLSAEIDIRREAQRRRRHWQRSRGRRAALQWPRCDWSIVRRLRRI